MIDDTIHEGSEKMRGKWPPRKESDDHWGGGGI